MYSSLIVGLALTFWAQNPNDFTFGAMRLLVVFDNASNDGFLTKTAQANPAGMKQPKDSGKKGTAGTTKLLFYRSGYLTLIDQDGKNGKKLTEVSKNVFLSYARLSPDGKMFAAIAHSAKDALATQMLYVRGLDAKGSGIDIGVKCDRFAWSPDSTEIATSDINAVRGKKPNVKHFVVNVKTKVKTVLNLPDDHVVSDWSRDGKYFLTTSMRPDKDPPSYHIHLMDRDGTEKKSLTDPKQLALYGLFSPDGSRTLYQVPSRPPELHTAPQKPTLSVVGIATGKVTPVAGTALNGDIMGCCWSPDGRQIAYTWREVLEGKPEEVRDKETESHLVVCDADGKNAKTIATNKRRHEIVTFTYVDWR